MYMSDALMSTTPTAQTQSHATVTEPFKAKTTSYGGRGLFATRSIPSGAILRACSDPYASAIYNPFRKEVCARCFAYAFDAGRNNWNIKHESAGASRFCSSDCLDAWAMDQHDLPLLARIEKAVQALAKYSARRPSTSTVGTSGTVASATMQDIDAAWQAAERADIKQGALVLDEMEEEITRFVLSAILRKHSEDAGRHRTGDAGTWAAFLELQDNELVHVRVRPSILAAQIRVFLFLRLALHDIADLRPYAQTATILRAVLARDHANAFGIFDMQERGDNEMLGWAVYVAGSYFNHDCAPNVRKQRVGREMRFYTTRDVAPGEELCISYVDQFRQHWNFDCVCARCRRERAES
ncbi:hypothetical protein BD626DRAFT_559757 [Schizophyllum amplum]|uniref:SET domain-containing protein n=1 Tax=Schizophyllum amplum TaxID=97359 RepID=A0A550C2E3_9AGAR|nr:hypothetical protein BD626DRAFT_559757 [Auriculariopsis ampla]